MSRIRVKGLAAFLTILPILAAHSASAQTAPAQTTQPATAQAMAGAIQAIHDANTVSEAAKAYAAGCNLDRGSADLNRAYLQRLIRLGQPETAIYPANNLVSTGSADGLTYWTLAYCSGRKSEYINALSWTRKAAATIRDSNALLYQLGQLTAWCDATSPAIPAADAKAVAQLKEDLSSGPAYAEGYNATKAVEYLKKQVAQEEGKGRAEEQQALSLKANLDSLNSQLRDLNTEIANLEAYADDPDNPDPRGTLRARDLDLAKRADLKDKIEAVTAEMQTHVDATLALKKTFDELQAKLKNNPLSTLDKAFRWSVPEVRE
jgi:hypothetical protein